MVDLASIRRGLRVVDEFLRPSRAEDRSVPVLDRGLMPNDAIDDFRVLWRTAEDDDGPDALVATGAGVAFSCGSRVHVLIPDSEPRVRHLDLGAPVGALAADGGGAVWAMLLDGRTVRLAVDNAGLLSLTVEHRTDITCPTDAAIVGGRLYVAEGSRDVQPGGWAADLMNKGASGRVVEVDPTTGETRDVVHGLKWAGGLTASLREGRILVSESWAHRIVEIAVNGGDQTVLGDRGLPGYPGRLSSVAGGRTLVAFPLLRTHLVELVLRDDDFRKRMMLEIDPSYWVAPALRTVGERWEPLQMGTAKHLGMTKPWAPPRVYGLAALMDRHGEFIASWHARAGSPRSGVTAAVEHDGRLVIACRGGWSVLQGPVMS